MTLLILLACILLLASAALLFGPQLVTYGTDGLRDLARRGDARFVSAFLIGALCLLVFAARPATVLISSGDTVQVVQNEPVGASIA